MIPIGEGSTAGGPPQFRLAHLVLTHPLADVAPGLGLTPDALAAKLTAAGFTVVDSAQPLTEIATASGKTEADLTEALIGGSA